MLSRVATNLLQDLDRPSRLVSWVLIFLSAAIGGLGISFFYLFLFLGLPGFIDLGFTPSISLWFDASLSILFFLQHSLMIRPRFRPTRLGEAAQPALFSIFSGVVLFIIMIFWQNSSLIHIELGRPGIVFTDLIYLFSCMGSLWVILSLDKFDPFGIRTLKNHISMKPSTRVPFIIKGPYRFVRHPLYFLTLLIIWANPLVTADRLMFNVMFTVWIVIGTLLEEKDLHALYGNSYRAYQGNVCMLVPCPFRFQRPTTNTDLY
ncbi:MAG: methyltransferase family protein [Syntrophobacteraceae bacterium]